MSQAINIPEGYVVCTATEGSCPLRATCLRSKTFREADYTSARYNRQLTVVNLWNAAMKPQTSECEMYREAVAQWFAQGFRHIFDDVPKGVYAEVQAGVEHVFTNRRYYFFCKKGERLTSPAEQEAIARVFKKYGIQTAPQYDKMVETYDYS